MKSIKAQKYSWLLIFLTFAGLQRLTGQWTSVGNITDFEKENDGIIITAPPAKIHVKILAPNVLRIRMSKDSTFLPDSSWAVVNRDLGAKAYTLTDSKVELILSTSEVQLKVRKSPMRLAFYDSKGSLIHQDESSKGMAWSGTQVAVWKTMPQDEQYFGFGEKAGALQRKWKTMSMWNSDIPGYKADTDPLYETIPFFYGIRKGKTYGIFFDNTYYSFFNMGKEHPDEYSFGAIDGELNYYFIYGPTPKEVVQKFSSLIGTMPLPP
ncbi:MAG TPA: hypothetical protein VI704_05410, partial [Bacteroidota bacterium]|nr:hypothetical protein [Bacteroidota bacterium]